jgi:hypothetical protein
VIKFLAASDEEAYAPLAAPGLTCPPLKGSALERESRADKLWEGNQCQVESESSIVATLSRPWASSDIRKEQYGTSVQNTASPRLRTRQQTFFSGPAGIPIGAGRESAPQGRSEAGACR